MRAVNLLPEGQRPHRASGERSGAAYVLVGVLGALLIAALFYALTANQVSTREQRTAEAQSEAQRAEARISALGPLGAFAQTKRTRIASVRDLAQARFDWERLVREVSLVLPRNTWLTQLDAAIDGSTLTASSTASVGGAAATPAPVNAGPSAKLAGCARRQPDVARLMVRIRRMHRVEDVTLNQSGQADSGGGASAGPVGAGAGTCGSSYSFDLTIAFATAPPVGPAKVPASLGGGS